MQNGPLIAAGLVSLDLMSVLAPVAEEAPPLQPENANPAATDQKSRPRAHRSSAPGFWLSARAGAKMTLAVPN
jgi:hypothetical protein